jgi:hypothetical protein
VFTPPLLAQFDVYRKDKRRHCRAVVCELNYIDGHLSGICFKYTDGDKEWMVFGSSTIFPFRSKLKKRVLKAAAGKTPAIDPALESSFVRKEPANNDNDALLASDRSERNGVSNPSPLVINLEENIDAANSDIPPQKTKHRKDTVNIDSFVVGGT